MKIKEMLATLVMLLPATSMASSTLDLNLRDSSFLARYSATIGQQDYGNLQSDVTLIFNEGSRRVLGAGLHLTDFAGGETLPVYAGIGGRLLYVDGNVESGVVLALGGYARVVLPEADRIALSASIHFSPSITSFGSANRYLEVGGRGEYHLLENAWVYLGFRRIRAGFEGVPTHSIDSGLHIGMRLEF